MDWNPLVEAVIGLAATAITVCTPVATAYLAKHTQNAAIARAVQVGAGVAYTALVAAHADGQKPDWHAAVSSAVANGVVAAEGLTAPGAIPFTAIAGALGHLLAADATVSAMGKGSVIATAPAGGSATATARQA